MSSSDEEPVRPLSEHEPLSEGFEMKFSTLRGERGVQGDKGDKGDQGDRGYDFQYEWEGTTLGVKSSDEEEFTGVDLKGEKGETGDAATITVGSVSSVPFGTPPTVTE